jgi:hypothetical protein
MAGARVRTGTATGTGNGIIVLDGQDRPKRAIVADRARISVGAGLHNGVICRGVTMQTADRPRLPLHPPCLLKSHFSPKKKVSPG